MSYSGMSPKVNRLRLQPRSADPVNPAEGDLQYADGTARPEGLYIYKNSVWTPVIDADSAIPGIQFTPQASDPVSPQIGDIFYADGSSRAEGLWTYTSSGWSRLDAVNSQIFSYNSLATCRLASSTVVSLSITPGTAFGGGTLVLGDIILLKNQINSWENGVYVVGAGGLTRHSSADTAAKLSYSVTYVTPIVAGSPGVYYFQNNILTNLTSDTQSWATTTGTQTFTVPAGVNEITVFASGGGGGGGGGGRAGGGDGRGGGGGGGAVPSIVSLTVTPGQTFSVTLGAGGAGGTGSSVDGTAGAAGNSTIFGGLIFNGGLGGGGSISAAVGVGAAGGYDILGARSAGSNGGVTNQTGLNGQRTIYALGGPGGTIGGNGGPGGGGGAGFGPGGNGANRSGLTFTAGFPAAPNSGGGGGGGAGGNNSGGSGSGIGSGGGPGGCGFVKVTW